MFIDRAVIEVVAGRGGSGSEAMRREKGVPRGGPAGGDGGKGGDVLLKADAQLATLLDYSYRRLYKADRGMHGAGKNMTGRSGDDLMLKVPPGTVAYDADSEEVLGELLESGQTIVLAVGGRGGRGNTHFKTPTQQAPRRWEPGGEGEQRRVRLELKLIADVGLVREPNAGKSTFLAAVTAARPKVGDYPFTTLEPNLGVVQLSDFRTFVVADIPGIIEGAHEGKGLGHQFLRHIERTRTLALVIAVDAPDVPSGIRGTALGAGGVLQRARYHTPLRDAQQDRLAAARRAAPRAGRSRRLGGLRCLVGRPQGVGRASPHPLGSESKSRRCRDSRCRRWLVEPLMPVDWEAEVRALLVLDRGSAHVEELAALVGLGVSEALVVLAELELDGWVEQRPGLRFEHAS